MINLSTVKAVSAKYEARYMNLINIDSTLESFEDFVSNVWAIQDNYTKFTENDIVEIVESSIISLEKKRG
jgi:hypothetical protein